MTKRLTTLTLAILLVMPFAANATRISIEFSGTITRIEGSGAGLSYGDIFVGSFSYDDQAPLSAIVEPATRAIYGTGEITAVVASTALSATAGSVQILDNWSYSPNVAQTRDDFFLSVRDHDTIGVGYWLIQIDMPDMSGLSLDGLGLPSGPKVAEMASRGRLFVRRFTDTGEEGFASGYFDMVRLSSVPEPGTLALLGLGLLGLGVTRRRKLN